jgi:hypothetical protein
MRPLFYSKGIIMRHPLLVYLLLLSIAFPAMATEAAKSTASASSAPSQIPVPPPEAQLIMIRTALIALSQANVTNNYAVLNALGSPAFQNGNSQTKLSQAFEGFRANRIDLAPVVVVMPQATQASKIENGQLRMVGLFPTQPMLVKYDMSYQPVAGQWRLSALTVNLDRVVAKPVAQK